MVLAKIESEPYFRWQNKMVGESTKCNKNLYCQYHKDHGYIIENCRNLRSYLDQLVREGKLKHLLHHPGDYPGQTNQESRIDNALRAPAGTINVPAEESQPELKKARRNFHPTLSFLEEDKIGTTQPHDDALVITLRIRDYDVRRVMVDDGSAAEVMYPDLYKGLGLKPEDLTPYSSPLMSFDGKLVIPKGMIRLPIQTNPEVVEVNFIVVDTYSPCTAIIGRPWVHTLGAVASSLYKKVKFPSGEQVLKIRGCQFTARQCMVAAISHRFHARPSTTAKESL
ncbi:uncharacterized protein LOC112015096 [Quercus suber]|uniref:uncharacterized protein LOC112015096 n=1 Tax=Quercus suber TaxID=58331 RepID=UPI000CE1FF34|nr:uncharacterized protein LOC112015096 [Quercus suber]